MADYLEYIIARALATYPKIVSAIAELKPVGKNNIKAIARKLGIHQMTLRWILYVLAFLGYVELKQIGTHVVVDLPKESYPKVIILKDETAKKLEILTNILQTLLLVDLTYDDVINWLLDLLEHIDNDKKRALVKAISQVYKELKKEALKT